MDKELIQADLNLLKVLDVLLEERNVTHAADRLFVSQPAISKALGRLRELFGDPLFIRSANGLIATTRAESLALPVRNAIAQLNELLKETPFDPATAKGNLLLAAPEPFLLGTIPDLVIALQGMAPSVSLEVLHLGDEHLSMLAEGALDYVIYLDKSQPDGFVAQSLLAAAPRVWFREGHPLGKKKAINLADTCAYPQVAFRSPNVRMDDLRIVESAMKIQGLQRRVIMSTSHIMIALDVLKKSDALMLGPDYLSRIPAFNAGIASHSVSRIPAFDHLKINLALIQHERTRSSALHQWVAAQIKETFSRRFSAPARKGRASASPSSQSRTIKR